MPKKTLIIGLTGGIASGKTAVSDHFQTLQIPVIDADVIAREVVEPNTSGLKAIVKEFSDKILTNGELNRRALRKIVFNQTDKLERLNSILHPLIRKEIIANVQQVTEPYCIVSIPLLCESTDYQWLDRILVVDVKKETQIKRLIKRDEIDKELALKMIHQQCSREQRLSIADDVINNEGTLEQLFENVELLDLTYKQQKI